MSNQFHYLSFGFEIISDLALEIDLGLGELDQLVDRQMVLKTQAQSHIALDMIWQFEGFAFEIDQIEKIKSDVLEKHLYLKGENQIDFGIESLPFFMLTDRFDRDRGELKGCWQGWGDGEIWLASLSIHKQRSADGQFKYHWIYHLKYTDADDLNSIRTDVLRFLEQILQVKVSSDLNSILNGLNLFLALIFDLDSSISLNAKLKERQKEAFTCYFKSLASQLKFADAQKLATCQVHAHQSDAYCLADLFHLMPMNLQAQYSMILEKQQDQQDWEKLIAKAKLACQSHEQAIEKIVCARSSDLDLSDSVLRAYQFDLIASFIQISKAFKQAHCYWMSKQTKMGRLDFMGATPEMLFAIEDHVLKTHALAGTIRNTDEITEKIRLQNQLIEDQKERKEHALVVDSLVTHLRDMSFLNIQYDQVPHVKEIGQLQHLESKIECELTEIAIDSLSQLYPQSKGNDLKILSKLHQLHPTPALGGRPKEQALSWLREHENFERGNYGAPFGWLSFTDQGRLANANFYVGIRGCLLNRQQAHASLHFFAGVGVVSESDPIKEWQESQMKMSVLLPYLRWKKFDKQTDQEKIRSLS
jgi:isochorismate synthase EntC